MAAPPKKINLLDQDLFKNSQIGKVLAWLLTAGRTIVIVVEIIVMVAFFSRFWLDKELNDLIAKTDALQAQVEASGNFEQDFKNIQTRLALVKQIDQSKLKPQEYVVKITSLLPNNVVLKSININTKKLTLIGNSFSEKDLAGVIDQLNNTGMFKTVTLASISLDRVALNQIKFTIDAELVDKK